MAELTVKISSTSRGSQHLVCAQSQTRKQSAPEIVHNKVTGKMLKFPLQADEIKIRCKKTHFREWRMNVSLELGFMSAITYFFKTTLSS